MRNATMVWLLCLGASLQSAALYAEESDSLQPGMRLRVTAPSQAPKRIVGVLTSVDPSVLTIQTSKEAIAFPREAIRTLELSKRGGQKRKGALIGAGAGVVAALIAAATTHNDLLTPAETGLVTGILFVPVGVCLGALVAPGERWVPVPAVPAPLANPRHVPGSFGLSLLVRF